MNQAEDWVLLAYRLPRVPSTPRSAVWRKLKRLGVAQLGDGLVALPADPRTREQLEWVAEEVTDRGGRRRIRHGGSRSSRCVHRGCGGAAAGGGAAAQGTAPHPGPRLLHLPA